MTTPADSQHKYRLLVVEDDPDTLTLLKLQLTRAGYDVIAGSNGREAVTALSEIGAQIIVADWDMPEMSGLELCRAVHELRELTALGLIYFIILTAHAEQERVVEAFAAGADDFVRKPYHLPELLARIRAGERILALQDELYERQVELSKQSAQLAGLNRTLERLANTDTLTNLPNRRRVLERLQDAWALAERHDQPLSCITFDIDHFKRVNDTFGHHAGDSVLQNIADSVRKLIRRYDVCGRVGGEEFLIVCPNVTNDVAVRIAERIRLAVANTPTYSNGQRIDVTISLGVTSRRPEYPNPDALLRAADALLYRAKEQGRNQTWCVAADGQPKPAETIAPAPVAP